MKIRNRMLTLGVMIIGSAILLFLFVVDSAIADDLTALLAQNRVTKFTAIDTTCEQISEGVTTVDENTGITHIEAVIYRGIVKSDNPLFNGTTYIIVDTEVNQETGETKVWTTGIGYPDFVDGSLIAPGKGVITEEGPNVRHRGYGIRELQGLRFRYDVRGAPEQDDLPCEPLFPPAQLEGVIIDMPAQ